MRCSSCIIRCTLDNMFRSSMQLSSSPSYAATTSQGLLEPTFASQELLHNSSVALPPITSCTQDHDGPPYIARPLAVELHHDEYKLPMCIQFVDTTSDHVRRASQPTCGARPVPASSSGPKLAGSEDPKRGGGPCSMPRNALTAEIREYDFLRHMDEGPGAAPDEVDCTLHLGRSSMTPSIRDCSNADLRGMFSTLSDAAAAASKQHTSDSASMQTFDSASRNFSSCQQDYGYFENRESKDSAGSMLWSSGSSAMMWRGESVGMSRMLRENVQDIEECENSSRTSSNSSGTTLKASAIIRDNPIMYTYDKSRDRDYSAAARAAGSITSSRWLQYGDQANFAGSLPSTKRMLSTHEHNRDSYLNPAAVLLSAYGGPLLPHVFSGTKSSNTKEGSNPVIRICAQCKTMRTPLWRNGPQGPKSLCNACGIRYKKEERRSAAVEDSKLQDANCPDQRSRFSMDYPSEDQRPRCAIADDQRFRSSKGPTDDRHRDQRSRLSFGPKEDRQSTFITDDQRSVDLSKTQRFGFNMDASEDQRRRFSPNSLIRGDGRSGLLDSNQTEKRIKLGSDIYTGPPTNL